MATLTAETKNSIATQSQYKLLIGSGFYLDIGSGYDLQIQPQAEGLTAQTKTSSTFTSETKN